MTGARVDRAAPVGLRQWGCARGPRLPRPSGGCRRTEWRDRCPGPGHSDAKAMESMVQTAAGIIAAMHEAVPRGRQCLTGEERQRLASLTQALLASSPEAQGEYGRFLAAARKDIDLPGPVLAACLQGKRILV